MGQTNMRRDDCKSFEALIEHELDHGFGFRHVARRYAVMYPQVTVAEGFGGRIAAHGFTGGMYNVEALSVVSCLAVALLLSVGVQQLHADFCMMAVACEVIDD